MGAKRNTKTVAGRILNSRENKPSNDIQHDVEILHHYQFQAIVMVRTPEAFDMRDMDSIDSCHTFAVLTHEPRNTKKTKEISK
uniref:Uncharacterized protein n=1 Tax=Romanomermis culicivorax TaxID=13658 RepID=A0A915IVM9_ROMCU